MRMELTPFEENIIKYKRKNDFATGELATVSGYGGTYKVFFMQNLAWVEHYVGGKPLCKSVQLPVFCTREEAHMVVAAEMRS